MKFSKLVKIITEAKNEQPGQRFKSVQDREGPASYVSGPIGKSDNFELRKNLNRWEFNPASDTDKKSASGISESSKAWRNMTNAFGLLANDTTFQAQVDEIANTFDKNREAYRHTQGVDDEGKVKKYDEESKSNSLPKTIQAQESRLEGYNSEVRKRQIMINHSKMPPGERLKLERSIASLEAELAVMDKQFKSDPKSRRSKDLQAEIIKKSIRLEKWKEIFEHTTLEKHVLDSLKGDIFDYDKKMEELTKKLEKNKEEYAELTERTQNIEANNQENNNKALEEFKLLINSSASELGMKLRNQAKTNNRITSLQELNWDNIPKDESTKIAMADALASPDSNINPVFGYIDRFAQVYYNEEEGGEKSHVKELDEREFNPQLNITKIRDYNNLPFVRLLKIYSAIRKGAKSSVIPLTSVDIPRHNAAYQKLNTTLNNIKDSPEEWEDPVVKQSLSILIKDLEISEKEKDDLYAHLNDAYTKNKRGFSTPSQFLSRIDSYCKDIKAIQKESFDSYTNRILRSSIFDEDDFKIDMIELLSK